jgi:hypothetical protein
MKTKSDSKQLPPEQSLDGDELVGHGSLEHRLKQLLREYVEACCCPRSAATNMKELISNWAESTDVPFACEDCHDESDCDDCICPICYPEDIEAGSELNECD